jgi:hypothetical protein
MRNGLRTFLVPSWAAILLLARTASAQEGAATGMHQSGGFILSAERMFGLSFWSVHTERDPQPGVPGATGSDSTISGTNVSLLFGSNYTSDVGALLPYTTPRLAFDFLPIESLTIGGSIGFLSSSGEVESANGATRDTATITAFALTPRVGYALMLTDGIYFWPRLGVTYFSLSSKTNPPPPTPPNPPTPERTDTTNGFAINIEPAFVFSLVNHFGISVIPVADIPLAGSNSEDPPDPPDSTIKIRNLGATVGLLGYF